MQVDKKLVYLKKLMHFKNQIVNNDSVRISNVFIFILLIKKVQYPKLYQFARFLYGNLNLQASEYD